MIFAWQGWKISLPQDWNPMKLEGNFEAGYALIADIHRPRLGMRWTTPAGKTFDGGTWAMGALRDEVGQLAAANARECKRPLWKGVWSYEEPEPPGRDVWIGVSDRSGRAMETVHHVRVGEKSQMIGLSADILDSSPKDEMAWAVFDLSCKTPAGWRLESQLLNAGDLRLTFAKELHRIVVRQIAVAHLALKRMPMSGWLKAQRQLYERNYHVVEERGVSCLMHRRRNLAQAIA